jgi:hypothetical protein
VRFGMSARARWSAHRALGLDPARRATLRELEIHRDAELELRRRLTSVSEDQEYSIVVVTSDFECLRTAEEGAAFSQPINSRDLVLTQVAGSAETS